MLDGLEIFQALTHLLPYEELDLPKVDPKGRSHKEVEEERRNQETNYYIGTNMLSWPVILEQITRGHCCCLTVVMQLFMQFMVFESALLFNLILIHNLANA